MDDLLSEFLAETAESLEVLDAELVKLEQDPNDPELLQNIFRLLHTIKGTCGFLGLPRLEAVAHAGENILGKFRDQALEVTPAAVTLILAALDRIKSLLDSLANSGAEPDGDDEDLIARLNAMADGGAPPAPAAAPAPAEAEEPAPATSLYDAVGGLSAVDAAVEIFYRRVLSDEALRAFFDGVDMDRLQGKQRAFLSMALGGPDDYDGADLTAVHAHLVESGLGDDHFDAVAGHLGAALEELEVPAETVAQILATVETTRDAVLGRAGAPPATDGAEALDKAAAPAPAPEPDEAPAADVAGKEGGSARNAAPQSIRVNVDVLENLMTVVSELVLTRNQVLQILRNQKDSEFAAPLQRLNQVTSELQESVMKTRMQPIGNAWAKLPRLVRDLTHDLGKKIDLEMVGADTELDRQVLDLIKDPLTHMIRNSADHGLESPKERSAAGKSETGHIKLRAYHEGGHIIMEIADDGRGLNIAKIKEKAVANGLASEAELEAMSDKQIQQFIFKAGFSTAAAVTSVSGRGVGMDVVRTNLEKIGGTVEVRSLEGRGTTFVIKIPLTLAIVSALIVECCNERFAVPQNAVVELVRITEKSEHSVEEINGTPVLRLRNRLLPLVSLEKLLKLTGAEEESPETYILVAQVGTFTFGIIVDRVFDTEEIVVKPVSPILRHLSLFSGNTILGDGSVIMILDPNGIAAAMDAVTVSDAMESAADHAEARNAGERMSLLLVKAGAGGRKAVPLNLVARIEEVDLARVEQVHGRPVIQYRNQLMPLVGIDGETRFAEAGKQPVLVFSDRDRSMGLVVEQIVDIVEQAVEIGLSGDGSGVLGSSIVGGEATDIVDAGHYLRLAFGDWFGTKTEPTFGENADDRRVLLVDDSPFFRNLLAPLLTANGYRVTTAENATAALDLCEAGEDFDVIISDIEMPGMNGFEFAETVRKTQRWQDTPLLALSSHGTAKDIERGRRVGFTDYLTKFDRDSLLSTLSNTLTETRGAA